MTIELTPEQKRFIEEQVATGRYASESALVGQALEVLRRRDERLAEVQDGYRRGLADLEAGRSTVVGTPGEAEAFGGTVKGRGRALRAERERPAR